MTPTAYQRSVQSSVLGPMPRFSILAIHIRAALYGYMSERVQYMVERNEMLSLMQREGFAFA